MPKNQLMNQSTEQSSIDSEPAAMSLDTANSIVILPDIYDLIFGYENSYENSSETEIQIQIEIEPEIEPGDGNTRDFMLQICPSADSKYTEKPTTLKTAPNENDGVFYNMSAKPRANSPCSQHPKQISTSPPAYVEIYGLHCNEISARGNQAGMLGLYNRAEPNGLALPVGGLLSFVLSFGVSCGLHILGFMVTFLLHNSQAAKAGSFAGFGCALINFAVSLFLHRVDPSHIPQMKSAFDIGIDTESIGSSARAGISAITGAESGDILFYNCFLSLLVFLTGVCLIAYAIYDFARAYKAHLLAKKRFSPIISNPRTSISPISPPTNNLSINSESQPDPNSELVPLDPRHIV